MAGEEEIERRDAFGSANPAATGPAQNDREQRRAQINPFPIPLRQRHDGRDHGLNHPDSGGAQVHAFFNPACHG